MGGGFIAGPQPMDPVKSIEKKPKSAKVLRKRLETLIAKYTEKLEKARADLAAIPAI